jgi:hypothetical protein
VCPKSKKKKEIENPIYGIITEYEGGKMYADKNHDFNCKDFNTNFWIDYRVRGTLLMLLILLIIWLGWNL